MDSVLETARNYVAAGLSVIPVKPDGSKAPDWERLPVEYDQASGKHKRVWKPYQTRIASDDELRHWFADGKNGIAIVCGQVSGGLEVLDFDEPGLFEKWSANIERDNPGALAKLPQVRTPDNGVHVYYRTEDSGCDKIAETEQKKTLIETKGEGGYVLAPGSPAQCHPSGRTYEHVAGPPITETPTLEGS